MPRTTANHTSDHDLDPRRTAVKEEISPVRATNNLRNRITTRTGSGSKRNGTTAVAGSPSPGPARTGGPQSASPASRTGPGRTPQTKRREFSLSTTEKSSPTGSPRAREPPPTAKPSTYTRTKHNRHKPEALQANNNNPSQDDSSRKSSNSSQDSGIGRDVKPNAARSERTRPRGGRQPPVIRTVSPEAVDIEVSHRKKFEELCDVKNVELGIVKVPRELLNDLIHQGDIESYYDVEAVPVAR